MTVFEAPVSILSKLYQFVKPTDGTALTNEAVRKFIVAFCASKISLIDPMPEIVHEKPDLSLIKRKCRYQADKKANERPDPEQND